MCPATNTSRENFQDKISKKNAKDLSNCYKDLGIFERFDCFLRGFELFLSGLSDLSEKSLKLLKS